MKLLIGPKLTPPPPPKKLLVGVVILVYDKIHWVELFKIVPKFKISTQSIYLAAGVHLDFSMAMR